MLHDQQLTSSAEADPAVEGGVPSGSREMGRGWRVLVVDAAVLVGLAGVAITQPVLELFGNNPTFFVAGGYGRRQIAAFALTVALVPALIVFVVSAIPGLVNRRVDVWSHGLAVAGLAGLFGLLVTQTAGVDGVWLALGLAVSWAWVWRCWSGGCG